MIRIGDYGLEPDANCWKLGRITPRRGKDGELREELTNLCYPTDLPSAMKHLLELRIRDLDPTTFEEIRDEIRAFRAELTERFTIRVEVG